jgi:hypothetical protein
MFVGPDSEIPPGRHHPWTIVTSDPTLQYRDFKTRPDLIRTVLEDFVPWAHYPAVIRFYEMLEWLNGPDSVFESNDCGLRPPREDAETPPVIRGVFEKDPLMIHGRLAFIFRDLAWNAARPTTEGLKTTIQDALAKNVPMFPAAIGIGEWPHYFTAINREGMAITLKFWAWGTDEAETMQNLYLAFGAIDGCLKWVSASIRNQTAAPAARTNS